MKKLLKKITAALLAVIIAMCSSNAVHAIDEDPSVTDGLYAEYAIVLDAETGQLISEKNPDDRMYPASMTKMMTAILAMEHLPDPAQTIVITDDMLYGLAEANASVCGFATGDTVTVQDILYGIALPSGADAANAAAVLTAGSIDGFTDLMNRKAAEIGMTGTHFVNCTGLHDDDHYSTARDMATLLNYCIQNETFRKVFSSKEYTSSPTQYYPSGIPMESTAWSMLKRYGITTPGLVGGKTGFTYEAGHCMAFWAELNGMTLISVVGFSGNIMADFGHLADVSTILKIMDGWERMTILEEGELLDTVTIHYSDHDETVDIISDRSLIYDMKKEGETVIESTLPEELNAKLEPYKAQGTITITRNGEVLFNEGISINVPREPVFWERLKMRLGKLFGKK